MNGAGKLESWKRIGHQFPRTGQGEVQLVQRLSSPKDQKFVLKTMRPEQAHNPARRARFEQEIQALQKLNNRHILPIEEFGIDSNGAPYLVTPYCPKGALRRELLPLGTVSQTLRFFQGICEGVAYAHSNNILRVVHRDLKPANIFLDEKDTAIVGDFGLCFLLDGAEVPDERITETSEVAVARWFGAPEGRDGRLDDVTESADVYSLGKLLYWLLSGGKIFDRENHRDDKYLLGRNLADRREFELVHQLLDKMIVYDPLQRYPSGESALEAVTNLITVIDAGGRPILRNFVHRCAFCAQGEYVFQNGPEDNQKNQEEAKSLGLDAPWGGRQSNISHHFWMVAVCNKCGHVQLFRPDLFPEAHKNWLR